MDASASRQSSSRRSAPSFCHSPSAAARATGRSPPLRRRPPTPVAGPHCPPAGKSLVNSEQVAVAAEQHLPHAGPRRHGARLVELEAEAGQVVARRVAVRGNEALHRERGNPPGEHRKRPLLERLGHQAAAPAGPAVTVTKRPTDAAAPGKPRASTRAPPTTRPPPSARSSPRTATRPGRRPAAGARWRPPPRPATTRSPPPPAPAAAHRMPRRRPARRAPGRRGEQRVACPGPPSRPRPARSNGPTTGWNTATRTANNGSRRPSRRRLGRHGVARQHREPSSASKAVAPVSRAADR